jgi:uncharacterized protein (DUF608 family)
MFGYSSVFGSHVPRGGPLNLPLIGLGVDDQTHLLTTGRTKSYDSIDTAQDHGDPVYGKLDMPEVSFAKDVLYWGHYPIADLEYILDSRISIGLRAWTPFIPGYLKDSMIPGVIFEVHMRNPTLENMDCSLAISFPGPTPDEAGVAKIERRKVDSGGESNVSGVTVGNSMASYALGSIGFQTVRVGGGLGVDGKAWAEIGRTLPSVNVESNDLSSSVAVDVSVGSGEEIVVRFVLSWHCPNWRAGGHPSDTKTDSYKHMYSTKWINSLDPTLRLAKDHRSLLRRVLDWQQVIYDEESLPVWLRQSLVNILHLITEDGMWAARQSPDLEWTRLEDGLFGMNESPRGCPQIECSPCSWLGNIPLVYFFPELALSTLRGYKKYQDNEGCPPWIFGGITMDTPPCGMTTPSRGYQVAQNVITYVDLVNRYWLRTADQSFLKEFYPSIKKTMDFTMKMNTGTDGLISFPDHRVSVPHEDYPNAVPVWETEGFEWIEWYGMSPHIGGMRLAQVLIVKNMATALGDDEYALQCQRWFDKGSKSLEDKLWSGDYYITFWDPDKQLKMDGMFAYQLDGQWMADFHGIPNVFREDRIDKTLQTIKQSAATQSPHGVVNFVNADGSPMKRNQDFIHNNQMATDFFTPEAMILGMTYIYRGQLGFGLDLVRRTLESVEILQKNTWDQPNIINGTTGKARFGNDYYQNLMLWSLPAAMVSQDLSGPCNPGGLVNRVIQAGNGNARPFATCLV